MNPISEHDFSLLADAVRRRRRAASTPEVTDALETHSFRVLALVDDLAEGESVNGMDYQVARATAILHDVAAPKARASMLAEASAALAAELLLSCGADPEFADAVERAVRRHDGVRALDGDLANNDGTELPDTLAEMLVHDACLLARLEATVLRAGMDHAATMRRMRTAEAALYTKTARRMASPVMDAAERAPATIG